MMQIFGVIVTTSVDGRYIDSLWISDESARERKQALESSKSATNSDIGLHIATFTLEDGRRMEQPCSEPTSAG